MDTKLFNPDGVGVGNGNYFGMPFEADEAKLVLISVPWDVTASYGGGASFGPDAIIEASTQLDFHDPLFGNNWKRGIATIGIDYSIQDKSATYRNDARKVIDFLEHGGLLLQEYVIERRLERVNNASKEMNECVEEQAKQWIEKGKRVGLVGGDHSVPLGLIKQLGQHHGSIGILHLDAHCDLREAYEGFNYSHASIMYNVLGEVEQVKRIVQVGVRDYSGQEAALAAQSPRVTLIDDAELCRNSFGGMSWNEQCQRIVDLLPDKVYISFDIDALTPDNCPSTGTPVPGGLTFNQAVWLIATLARSGRTIVGFDLCEVAPAASNEWDANVGARILFKLCGAALEGVRG